MKRSELLWACIAAIVSFCIFHSHVTIYAQSLPAGNSSTRVTPGNLSNAATVSSTITLQVSNETMKVKEATLKNSVIDVLNAPNDVLKTSDSDQSLPRLKLPIRKTT